MMTLLGSHGLAGAMPALQAPSNPSTSAQLVASPAASSPPALLVDSQINSDQSLAIDIALAASEARVSAKISASQKSLEHQIASLKRDGSETWLPALFGVLGTLVAAGVAATAAVVLQKGKLKSDAAAAQKAVGEKAVADIKAYRAKQLNEFYAPLQATLKQGLLLRNEFYNRLLAIDHPNAEIILEWRDDPIASNNRSLWIFVRGEVEAVPFRLIDQQTLLKLHFKQLLPNIYQLIIVGDLIANHIHAKIGLVRYENAELSEKLGMFLAHHIVMKEVYATENSEPFARDAKGYSAAYPRGLDALVAQDCEALRRELAAWEIQASEWAGIQPSSLAVDSAELA